MFFLFFFTSRIMIHHRLDSLGVCLPPLMPGLHHWRLRKLGRGLCQGLRCFKDILALLWFWWSNCGNWSFLGFSFAIFSFSSFLFLKFSMFSWSSLEVSTIFGALRVAPKDISKLGESLGGQGNVIHFNGYDFFGRTNSGGMSPWWLIVGEIFRLVESTLIRLVKSNVYIFLRTYSPEI